MQLNINTAVVPVLEIDAAHQEFLYSDNDNMIDVCMFLMSCQMICRVLLPTLNRNLRCSTLLVERI